MFIDGVDVTGITGLYGNADSNGNNVYTGSGWGPPPGTPLPPNVTAPPADQLLCYSLAAGSTQCTFKDTASATEYVPAGSFDLTASLPGPGGGGPQGGGNTSGGPQQPQKLKDKNGVPCDQKILGRFNSQFGTNVPLSKTTDLGALGFGHVTDNINIYFPLGSLPLGQVHPGTFGGGPFGTGSTLHVVSFSLGPNPLMPGTLADIARVHLDQGNPSVPPLGPLSHLNYVLTHSAGPCP